MEHVERQDERERELSSEVDELEQQGDQLEEEGERVDRQIGETREEFEQHKQSSDVPGAQENANEVTGTMNESQGSDVDPRPGTSENPGAADDEGQATGNPPADDAPASDDDDESNTE